MHAKRPACDLVGSSQTTFARTLRRDLASLDGHVPARIRGRTYRAPRVNLRGPAALAAIAIGMALATYLGTH